MNEAGIKSALFSWLSSELGVAKVFTIDFDADFVSANAIDASFNSTAIDTVNFTTDHETTLQLLAEEIQKNDSIFTCEVTDDRQLTCTGFKGVSITRVGPTVTGGLTQAIATLEVLTDEVFVTVFFADQDGPRPISGSDGYPFSTIRLDSIVQYGFDDEREVDDQGIQYLGGQRGATVSIHYFGENPMGEISKAYSSLEKQSVLDNFLAQGIAIQQKEAVQNLTSVLETKYDPHAFFELAIGFSEETKDDVSFIEKVEVTGTFEVGEEEVIVGPEEITI